MSIPGNTNPLLLRSASTASAGISRSLRFNSSDSGFLSRTPASAGNRKTWTYSFWIKYCGGSGINGATSTWILWGGANATNFAGAYFNANSLRVFQYNGSGYDYQLDTTQVFRDQSAWYHFVIACDTTQSTASNRIKVYVNGQEITTFSTSNYPTQNLDTHINSATQQNLGGGSPLTSYLSGYLADVIFVDGQTLTPSSFTEVSATTGQLIPKAYTGSFGTNGFWLKFSDNSNNTAATLGKDYSGNNNNWTPNNLSVTAGAGNDSLVDTPTSYGTGNSGGDVRGNFATWNPLDTWLISGSLGLANGNLDSTPNATNSWKNVRSTFSAPSSKWYYELTFLATSGNTEIGVFRTDTSLSVLGSSDPYAGQSSSAWVYQTNGRVWNSGSYSTYTSASAGDVAIIAFDVDAGKIWFGLNGTWFNSGNPASGTNALYTNLTGAMSALLSIYNASESCAVNFGQRAFAYTAPSGFKALCDTNLTAPVIAKPSTVMDVKLYTGNGSTQTISGLGFSPDLIWIKSRSAAYDHQLGDTVRGVTNILHSNLTAAESTLNTITGTSSDGFTVSAASFIGTNANGQTFAAWTWDAGTSTVTNTQGSITSTVSVRANPSAGFSIVGYSGASGGGSWGHGLGVEPIFIIFKRRNAGQNWFVFHKTSGSWRVFEGLNNTNADSNYSGSMSASSTVVSLPSIAEFTTDPSSNYIAYCWAPVAGYSSFGSYTGNGSTDGPFVYTGFRPRWVMIKPTNISESWNIIDAARSSYNAANDYLAANTSNQENVGGVFPFFDFTSNGFKVRASGSYANGSGNTYVWAAFAESPFQYARAR